MCEPRSFSCCKQSGNRGTRLVCAAQRLAAGHNCEFILFEREKSDNQHNIRKWDAFYYQTTSSTTAQSTHLNPKTQSAKNRVAHPLVLSFCGGGRRFTPFCSTTRDSARIFMLTVFLLCKCAAFPIFAYDIYSCTKKQDALPRELSCYMRQLGLNLHIY